jgi:hypothetical protein
MADVTVTLTAQEAQLLAAMKKAEDAQERYNKKLAKSKEEAAKASAEAKKTGDQFAQMGKRSSDALDPTPIGNFVTKFASVTAAITAATDMWQLYKQKQSEALGSLMGTANPDRMLTQVAEAGQLPTLIAQADRMAVGRGMDRNAARNLLFQAISDGFYNDVESVAAASSVIDPNEAAIVAGQTRGLFKGDNLSAEQAMSMTLTGAKISRLDFGPMAKALPQAAEGAAQIQSTASETIATLAILAGAFKSGDTAADRIKGFASKAALDNRTRGKGLLAAFDTVAAMTEEDRAGFLGESQELNAAFTVIKNNRDLIEQTRSDIEADRDATAQGGGLLRQRISETEQTPQFQARLKVESSRIRNQIANENSLALNGSNAITNQLDTDTASLNMGQSFINRWAASYITPFTSELGIDPTLTAGAIGVADPMQTVNQLGAMMPLEQARLEAAITKQADSAEKIAKAAEQAAKQLGVWSARANAAQGTKP